MLDKAFYRKPTELFITTTPSHGGIIYMNMFPIRICIVMTVATGINLLPLGCQLLEIRNQMINNNMFPCSVNDIRFKRRTLKKLPF